jgi:hypothetical protein
MVTPDGKAGTPEVEAGRIKISSFTHTPGTFGDGIGRGTEKNSASSPLRLPTNHNPQILLF